MPPKKEKVKATVWSNERVTRQGQSIGNWPRNMASPRTANVHPSRTASSWRCSEPMDMSNQSTSALLAPPHPTKIVSRSSKPTVSLEEFQWNLPIANSESLPSTLAQDWSKKITSPGDPITNMMQHNSQPIIPQSVYDDPYSLLYTPPPTIPTAAPQYKEIRILSPPTPNSDVNSPEGFDLAANAESYRAQIGAWMDKDIEISAFGTVLCGEFAGMEMGMGAGEISATRTIVEYAQKRMKGILDYFDERILVAKKGPEVEW